MISEIRGQKCLGDRASKHSFQSTFSIPTNRVGSAYPSKSAGLIFISFIVLVLFCILL